MIKCYQNINEIAYALIQKLTHISQLDKTQHIALSGGQTPTQIFEIMKIHHSSSSDQINWDRLHFWWVDERFVSYSDPESNYGTAFKTFFHQLNPSHLHPIPLLETLSDSLKQYEENLNKYKIDSFDWIWLGIGEDGHTASIFPGQDAMHASGKLVETQHPVTNQSRIGFTLPFINQAKYVSFIALGERKKDILSKT